MLCLCAAQSKFWFQTDLGRENSASFTGREDSCLWLFSPWSRIGHALRPFFMLWLVKRWVHAENLCSILNLVYFDSWSWQSFVSTWDVFNCLFPLDVQNEIQLLWRVFCYSWIVCLLVFSLRNTSLVKVESHRVCFSPCLMRKRVEKSEAILALLDSFQELYFEW